MREEVGEFAAFAETWCYWLTLRIANAAISIAGIDYLPYFISRSRG